jgi:Tfp pilus assembly protein PilV
MKMMIALLALALFVPAIVLAQNNSSGDTQSQAQQQEANQSAMNQVDGLNTSPHHQMTGMVSDDGKTFTSDNTTWHVSNPHALKDYNGQNVTVKFQFNTERNTIKIDKVETGK